MKNLTVMALAVLTLASCDTTPKKDKIIVNYPTTAKVDTVDTYFDIAVNDPFRWLEDDRSTETEAWVKEQNKVTYGYLDQIPFREALKKDWRNYGITKN
tara:strand:- start:36333 stop:36629 length:297 start_codon:yes stop_codon:yes gene_type:complete